MRPAVRDAFVSFSTKFEGCVPWMYLDILGLVTVGIGNLIDPIGLAMSLPFVRKGTTIPATPQEIKDEWVTIKRATGLARHGHLAAEPLTNLRLTADGVYKLVMAKLETNWSVLTTRFPNAEDWPADAQLGLCSMAWAAGPRFKAPLFDGHCRALDFMGARGECRFNDSKNPGLRPRNVANELLFENAAWVVDNNEDRTILRYPLSMIPTVV